MIDSGCQFGGAFDFLFLTTDGHRKTRMPEFVFAFINVHLRFKIQ